VITSLRGGTDDFFHVLGGRTAAALILAQRVERGCGIACRARIGIQPTPIVCQISPNPAVSSASLNDPASARSRAEAAVFAFEHVADPGEAALSEQRAESRSARAPRVHALQHSRRTAPPSAPPPGARCRARGRSVRVELESAPRRAPSRKRERRPRMPPLPDMLLPHAQSHARPTS